MARLSTHVLDIGKGRPAAGIPVQLFRDGALVATAVTNEDGRAILDEAFPVGIYEWRFTVQGEFFDEIPIRFRVTEPEGKYHVPLLLSGYGYSTYRGS